MTTSVKSSFGKFDQAIVNALQKNPQGLRYSELCRRSGNEYRALQLALRRRINGEHNAEEGNRINVKTFDKHLKGLVAEGILERIEERRSRVLYKIRIAEDSFPKRYVADARKWIVPSIVSLAKNVGTQFSETLFEDLINDYATHLIKDSLMEAIKLYPENPAWARYLVDESTELTRNMLNEIVIAFGKEDDKSEKVALALQKVKRKRSRHYVAEMRRMYRMDKDKYERERAQLPSPDFTIDLAKQKEEGNFDCPHCGQHISPDDETGEFYDIITTEVIEEGLKALIIKCSRCNSVIALTGFLSD
jgi:hypothetical protein